MNAKKLTKEMLSQYYGITSLSRTKEGSYMVGRISYNKAGRPSLNVIYPREITGRPGKGLYVSFSCNSITVQIALNRLVYAWYVGDLSQDDFIAHVNGNMNDCAVWNLAKVDEAGYKAMAARTKEEIEKDAEEAARKWKETYGSNL